jgi:hypothetical protein
MLRPQSDWLWSDRVVLVGVTYVDQANRSIGQRQFWGVVQAFHADRGVHLALRGGDAGKHCLLPPDPSRYRPAKPGSYTLKSTGETLRDPDFLSTWIMDVSDPESFAPAIPGLFEPAAPAASFGETNP